MVNCVDIPSMFDKVLCYVEFPILQRYKESGLSSIVDLVHISPWKK